MLLAIVFPFLSFFFRGKIITAIICFILQITILGWLPAAIWAAMSFSNERSDKRNEKLIRACEGKSEMIEQMLSTSIDIKINAVLTI